MSLLVKLYFLLGISEILARIPVTPECKKSSCLSYSHFYTEIGCTPVLDENNCYPTHFECPDFVHLDKSKCHYRGKSYIDGEKGPELENICLASCFCDGQNPLFARIECANIECPDYFLPPLPGTILQYNLDGCCCPYNTVQASDALHMCTFERKIYYEGEKMYTKAGCFKCICSKDFDASIPPSENPNCRLLDCGYQVRNLGNVINGCVPIGDECCSVNWKCPHDQFDKVVPGSNHADVESGDPSKICTFGSLKLAVGDLLEESDNVVCSCNYPPLVECRVVTRLNNVWLDG